MFGKPLPREKFAMLKYGGAVSITRRDGVNVFPPSREVVKTPPRPSTHVAYRVPSSATAARNPTSPPVSSRGSPGSVLTTFGVLHVRPSSVDREKNMTVRST